MTTITPNRKLLRQLQHAAGLDPDGPRLVPMRPLLSQEQAVQAAYRAAKVVVRDAMLRRALGTTFGEQCYSGPSGRAPVG